MIRWLQDNPVGLGLAVFCGLLLLAMVLLGIMSMLPVDRGADGAELEPGEAALALPELAESPPLDAFYVITERPLFNETRQPEIAAEVEGDPLADAMHETDDEAPEVELSGVVITPSLRMATLRKKDADRSLVAFEGRPIEGDFGSWQLSRVAEREVVLTSGSGEELLLKLKVHDEQIEPPERPAGATDDAGEQSASAAPAEQGEGQRLTRAEEIRQRIAERREELRLQAEMAQQAGQDQAAQEEQQPDYQEAIRAMIGRNRRGNDDNPDEE